ncbi:MAG: response regulator [Rhodospirillales bacterium]|nr:response regulator [Rhodospirillales bacterium]MCB9997091.1 response regulator [Rhodospirillales bacterium]
MAFDFRKLSILVVEDTAPMRKLIASVLETMDVGLIYTAENGQEGYEQVKKFNPDIVIADWHMEPVNGIELTREIRTNTLSPNRMVPVILVTGYSAMNRVAEARDAGVTEFLVKPFSANDLAKRIAYVITKPRDFIDCADYFGPDRRRRNNPDYKGPFKREEDKSGANTKQA